MLVVPALTILDTDASLKDDRAGYCIKMDNPTESDIENYSVKDRIFVSSNPALLC